MEDEGRAWRIEWVSGVVRGRKGERRRSDRVERCIVETFRLLISDTVETLSRFASPLRICLFSITLIAW